VLGVLFSVVLPIVRSTLPVGAERHEAGQDAFWGHVWVIAKPYVMVGLFSLIVGLLVTAFAQDSLNDWRAALLAGYAADSTLQKLRG
jgi:hypothetical protein